MRTSRCLPLLLLSVLLCTQANVAIAQTLLDRVSGFILLDVENHGEAWYADPIAHERSFLGRPDDAFALMRQFGLGILDTDLEKIPTSDENFTGDSALRERLSGRILLQVEQHGEAWYVYPNDLKRYSLGRPAEAFAVMSRLGLGVSEADLSAIPIAPIAAPVTSAYQSYSLTLPEGSFNIKVVSLNTDAFAMHTNTADSSDCTDDCAAQSLESYARDTQASIGIHGTYFCPPDYASCANLINSFFSPVFNSSQDVMLNESSLAVHQGPMIVYTDDGSYHFFHRTADFGSSVNDFESRTGKRVTAAIANYPSLVENGISIVLNESRLEESQRTVKATRGGIGMNDDQLFLVIAQSATLPDLAAIFQALGATYAMNLDGGGSAALLFENTYRVGPGRLLPNAITFTSR